MSTAFRIQMDNLQETPDTTSPATALGTVVFDDVAVTATYRITVAGLDFGPALGLPQQTADLNDDVGGIHVHNANRDVNGNIVFGQRGPAQDNDDLVIGINPDGTTTFSGIWETTDPPNGANPELADFAATLAAATLGADAPLYWNIHTTQFPGGAIRGQWVCIATDNSETVSGTAGDDVLPGLGGDDSVDGGFGRDQLSGGGGNDTINGAGGFDTADYTDKAAAVVMTLNGATNATVTVGGLAEDTIRNIENVFGGSGGDSLTGDSFVNTLRGGLGNDTLNGAGGFDTADYSDKSAAVAVTLNGPSNAAVTVGGLAEDTIRNIENVIGGSGADSLTGDFFANTLRGGLGADTLNGAGAFDTADYSEKSAAVAVTLNRATNAAVTVGGVAEDPVRNIENVFGGIGGDSLTGDFFANTFRGGLGADTLSGAGGFDTADYSDKTQAVAVTLTGAVNAAVMVGGLAEDTLSNIENLMG